MKIGESARRQLERAAECLELLRGGAPITNEQADEAWRDFLGHIERCWNKASAHYSKSPKWQRWASRINQLRSNDELLKYLLQARNAHEHGAETISTHRPGYVAINPRPGSNSLYIEKLEIANGRIVTAKHDGVITGAPPHQAPAASFLNRQVPITPPKVHLGEPLPRDLSLADLAAYGFEFYENLLSEIEAEFVPNRDAPSGNDASA